MNLDRDSECSGCTPKSNGVLIRDEVSNHTCNTGNTEPAPVSMDEILKNIGTCGRYQYMQAFALSFLIIPMGYQMFIMYFTGHSPNWRCVNGTNSQCNITGEISPAEVDLFNSRCNMPRDSWEYVTPRNFSFITEFDLVCDKTIIATFANSVMYIAWGIGSIPLGMAADYFGRTPVLFTSYLVILTLLLSSACVSSVWQFIFLRAMIGLFLTGHGMPSFALGSEMVGIKFRSTISNIFLGFETIALLLLTLQAYYIREWRRLTIMCSAPYIGLIVLFWYIDESPRWLRSQGHLDKSTIIMKKMASINQQHYPSQMIVQFNDKKKSCGTFINLFRPAKQLMKTLLLSFGWMITAMGFFGLSLVAGDLSGNMYRDFALVSLIEFPAIIITVLLLEKLGRRKTTVACLLFAGIFCCMIIIFPQKSSQKVYPILRIVAGMAGKLCNVIAFGAFYVWTGELYPTTIRTQGLSFASFSARVGATPAPFLTESLKLINPSLPFILMGVLSILSGLTSLFLPETVGKPMLESFDPNIKAEPCDSNGIVNTTCQVTDDHEDIARADLYRINEEDALIQSNK